MSPLPRHSTISSALARLHARYHLGWLVFAFVVFWIPVIVFAKLAGEILENEPFAIDESILRAIHQHASPLLDWLFVVITQLGSAIGVIIITAIVAGWLVRRRLRRPATIVLASVAGAAAANVILKLLFHRDRPAFWHTIVTEHSYSFPSGHAMASSALAASIVVVAWPTRWRWHAVVLAGLYVALVGLSRLYLGVHFPTDIVAGWCVSVAWVSVVVTVVAHLPRPGRRLFGFIR